jgi:hypothetical protein
MDKPLVGDRIIERKHLLSGAGERRRNLGDW